MVSLKEAFDLAFDLAVEAKRQGDVPVGAVIAKDGEILAASYNKREALKSPTAHAEILAIEEAAKKTGDWRLDGASLIVTLEPCIMCAGAIINSRIKNIFFSAFDSDFGACGGHINVFNKSYIICGGMYKEKGEALIKDFFRNRRKD